MEWGFDKEFIARDCGINLASLETRLRRANERERRMGIKELSLELAAVSLIADEAKKAKDRLRAALQAEMDKISAEL
ncbi:hypothetical protein BSN82_16775, partial [Acinetobacter baylyi]